MSRRLYVLSLFLLLSFAGLSVTAAADDATPAPLTRVEAKKVCMVNDSLFTKDQIPVEVDKKTYYGCCEMCKDRLAKDAKARTAADPVTGKAVDKALAVIGAAPDGSVLYFENQESFDRYNQQATQPAEGSR